MIGKDFKATITRRGAIWREFDVIRNEDFRQRIVFKNVDWSGDTFVAQIRHLPDSGGSPLAEFAIDGPTFALSDTSLTLSLDRADGVIGALPAAPETGQNAVFYWDLIRISDGVARTLFAGPFTVAPGTSRA